MTCADCEKECEHDLYSNWCNECGERVENEMIDRLISENLI